MNLMKIDIIGGGLAGLGSAISIKSRNPEIEVIVHEKYKIHYHLCQSLHLYAGFWLLQMQLLLTSSHLLFFQTSCEI